jgi:hypothetical protein
MPEISLLAFEEAFDDGLKSVHSTPWLALQLKILERLYNRVEETIHPSQRQSYETELSLLLSQVIERGRKQDFQTLSPEILTFSLSRLSKDDFPKAYRKAVFSLVRAYIRLQAYSELTAMLSEAGLAGFTDSGVEALLSSGKELDETAFRAQVLPRVSSEVKAEVGVEWHRRGHVSSSDSVLGLFVVHQGEENTGIISRVELSHLRVRQKEVMDQVRVVSHLVETGNLFSDQSRQVCAYLKLRHKLPEKRSLRLEYSIDQPATHLGGNSIGLILAVLGGMGLYTYNRNRPFKYVVYEDVAFTGALDEDGNVLPVNKDMLPPKLEAAFYSGVSTVVLPRKQLKEARAVIKQLQSRYPRRSINLIPVQSYEEVLARREVLYLQRRQIKERSRQFVKDHANGVTLSAMVFVVMLFLGFWFGIVKNGEPASFTKTNEDRVVIRNKYGFALWKTEPGVSSKRIIIEDIDGDDEPEILVGYNCSSDHLPSDLVGNLVCYNAAGNIDWKINTGKTMVYGDNIYPDLFSVRLIEVDDCNFDGIKEIICTSQHDFFPTRIMTVSIEGKILSDYWNSGAFSDITVADVWPGNGVKEILATGTNNNYRTGILVVLDPFKMYGASPQSQDYYTNRTEPLGNAIYYLKFPLTHFTRLSGKNNRDVTREIILKNDKIKFLLSGPSLTKKRFIDMFYFLNTKMEVLFVDLADGYYNLYALRFPDREPLPYNDPELLDYFRKVQYWDGDTWRDSATMNRRYTLPE